MEEIHTGEETDISEILNKKDNNTTRSNLISNSFFYFYLCFAHHSSQEPSKHQELEILSILVMTDSIKLKGNVKKCISGGCWVGI